jgi:uncharacterized protein (TIGR03545 family)
MRWKFLIPSLIITAAAIIFSVLLLDTFLKRAAIASGEFIFGARVEITSLETRFRDMSVRIKGLSVANKREPFKNLFEVGEIKFSVNPVHLLSRKFIINEMTVAEIRTGTDRKTSGALPLRKIRAHDARRRKEETLMGRLIARLEGKSEKEVGTLPAFSEIKSAKREIEDISLERAFSVDELKSLREFEILKSSLAQKNEYYKKKLAGLEIDEKISLVNSRMQAVSELRFQDLADIERAKKAVEELNQARLELESAYQELSQARKELLRDFGTQAELISRINELKNKDYERIAQRLGLPQVLFDNISEAIFGSVWINRVNTALHYIQLARKYMPSRKKGEKRLVFTRRKGRDIIFPKEHPPAFLLKRAQLRGSFGSAEPVNFSGMATDIASDPALHGQPALIKMEGTKGPRRIDIFANLNHTQENPYNLIRITYSGFEATALGLPESEYLPSLKDSLADISAEITLSGENLDSHLKLSIQGIGAHSESSNYELKRFIEELWRGISEINVAAHLFGTKDNLQLKVTSDIDEVLSSRLQGLIGDKLAEFQARLRAEIDKLTEPKEEELIREFNEKKEGVEALYAQKQKEAQAVIDAAEDKSTKFEQKAREQLEREERKVEEELRRKIDEKLPDVFRR